MKKLGYGQDHRLSITTSVRDLPYLRDPAVLLNDQLKEVYIDGELEVIDTTKWFSRVMPHDYTVALSPLGVSDPDQTLYNVFGCGGDLNYNGYCNAEVDKLIDRQSAEPNPEKRETLAWQIERMLAENGARPIIFFDRRATCWQPRVKGFTIMIQQHLQRRPHGGRPARPITRGSPRAAERFREFQKAAPNNCPVCRCRDRPFPTEVRTPQ